MYCTQCLVLEYFALCCIALSIDASIMYSMLLYIIRLCRNSPSSEEEIGEHSTSYRTFHSITHGTFLTSLLVGDTSIIGAGTYANDNTCAVSATGKGEEFMRAVAAYDVSGDSTYYLLLSFISFCLVFMFTDLRSYYALPLSLYVL